MAPAHVNMCEGRGRGRRGRGREKRERERKRETRVGNPNGTSTGKATHETASLSTTGP
jgi:hypothetical protein